MNYLYKLLTICLLLPLFQSNASFSEELPKPKSNSRKPLDCGIPAPTIVNYGCLDRIWSKDYKRIDDRPFLQFGENPIKVYKTPDGGYIFASASQFQPSNSGSTDLWVVKVDATGNKVWSNYFGTTSADSYTSFVKTLDGGYILGGSNTGGVGGSKTSGNKGGQDAWIIKIDANGKKVWDKSFGGIYNDFLTSMISTSDNGFLLGINSESPQGVDKSDNSNGLYDAWIIKLDANGNKIWDKDFGGDQTENLRALSETSDGYLLGANSNSGINGSKSVTSKGGYDMWVLKMDFNGNKIWDNGYGGTGADATATINKDSDGSFLLGGTSNSPISGDKTVKSRGGFTDIWLVKISASGTKLWDKTIGGNQYETLTSVTTTSTGSFIVNLKSNSPVSGDKNQNPGLGTSNPYDLWLFEINSSGTKLWDKIMLGSSQTQSGDLLVDGNNLIVLGGPVNGETPQTDFWNAGLRKISYCQPQNISSTTICQKQCTVFTANDCASGVVRWSNGQYGASICTSPNTTQNYKAVCLSSDSTCVGDSSAVFTVNVNAVDNLSISPTGYTAITCGQSQTITATGCTSGVVYWTGGLTGNSITVTPVKDRAYKATCTTPNGCTTDSLSAWFTVDRFNVPSSSIQNNYTHNLTVCIGKSVTLVGNDLGGISSWTGGVQGSTLTITPTINTAIKYFSTQANGCSFPADSDYVYITVVPAILKPTIANYNCLKKVWDKRFGGSQDDGLTKTIKLSDGYLLAGVSISSTSGDKSENNRGLSEDYWIVKIDNNGNKVWDKTFGGTGSDILTDAVKLLGGGFVLVGQSDSGIGGDKTEASKGLFDYWIVKIDANGNKIWDKTYGGDSYDQGVYVRETNDGLLIGGTSLSPISGNKTVTISPLFYHFWILKLDGQGNKLWEKQFGGTDNHQYLTALEVGNSNEYLLLGYSGASANTGNKTSANKGGPDYWLVKIDANGNKIWDKSYGGSSADYAYSMVVSNDGKITMLGTTASNVQNNSDVSRRIDNNSNMDIWVLQVGSDGNKIWNKTYGTIGYDNSRSITLTSQGRYIISGYTSQNSYKSYDLSQDLYGFQYPDYWIIELDANGNKLWDRSFGGFLPDYVSNIIEENNNLFISGSSYSGIGGDKSQSSQGDLDYWLVKMDICQPNISNSVTICKNDSTFLTAQGCPNASTVKWSNGEYVQTISVKPSVTTTYKAICISTDPGTCQSDSSIAFTVSVNTIPPPSVNATNTNVCLGESTTLTATGCQGTYGWTGGATTSSITVNPAATKTYKVACNSNGCTSDSTSTIITVNPLPTKPTITTQSQNICVGRSIILAASGCNNGIYQWTGGLTGSSITVNPTNTTSNYKVACKVSNCVSDSSIAVTITTVAKPAIPIITPPSNNNICGGTNVSLTASACAGGTLSWTGGLTGNSITVSPVATKSYKAVCTINGCSSDSSSAATITVNPKPAQPTISSTGNSVCQGQNVILNASTCPNGTYGWTGGLTTSSITISSLGTKSYKVACTVNGCTSDSSLVTTVQISAKPSTPTIVPPISTSICQGSSVSLLANGCSGGTLGWTGGIIASSFTIVLPIGIKSYKVACTINGCTSDSSSAVTITVNPKPSQPTINQASQTICAGQSLNLTVTPVGTNTYAWTGGLTGTSITVSPITTKLYKVAALANGCTSDSSLSVSITVQATSPYPTTTNATVCEGGTLIIGNGLKSTIPNCSGGGSSSVTATYTGGTVGYDGGSSSGSNPTATISGMSSPITKVKVSITWLKKGGGGATSCGTAHNGGNPYHGETSFRVQAPDGTILNLVNNGTYSGSTTSTITTVFEDGFPAVALGIPISGTFSPASVLSVFNGKIPNGVWTLLPNDNGSGDPLCVSGFTVIVTAGSVAVPSSITWWDAQSNGNQVGTGAEYLPTTNTLASGTYTYYAQASCTGLCPSPRITATLTVSSKPAMPIITPPTNSTICQGSSIALSATGCLGGTYTWTGGLNGSSISVSPSSTKAYKVACTLNTCTSDSSSAVIITVTLAPVFSVNSNKTSICSGDSAILTVTGCTGTILWSNGAITSVIKVSPVTNTTYTATCSVGTCTSNQSISITPLTAPNVTSSSILHCGQTVTLTANNVPVGSNIQWRKDGVDITNATNNTVVINSAGSYDFTSYIYQNISTVGSGLYPNQVVSFIDQNIGFVINEGSIFKTRDGGVTWIAVYSVNFGPTIPLRSITFISPTVGWAVGQNGIYLKTVNGGDSWTYTYINTNLPLMKIKFRDPNNGIIVGDFGAIYTTSNGGITWTSINTFSGGSYPTFLSLSFVPNTTNVWAIGSKASNGFIAKSTDNGITWSETSLGIAQIPANTIFNNITFTTENNGFIVGDNGAVFKTTNGGVNWQLQSSPVLSSLKDIQFLNSQVGYICGTFPNGSLLKTTNGGNTWQSLYMPAYPVSLSFVDENTGWLTNYGNITKYIAPQCSTTPIAIINNCCLSPIPTVAPINPTFCNGGNVTLTASGCAGTYSWTGGHTGSSITVSVAKTYKVTCRMNNCNSDSASVFVTNIIVAPPTIALGGEVCTNNLPTKIWDKSISTPSGSSVNTLIKTNDGGMFTVIQEPSTTTIAKLDAAGTIVWSRALFSVPAGTVKINAAVATVDGGYLLAGKSNSASVGGDVSTSSKLGVFNNPTDDFWILKIDANGLKQWDKRFGGNYNDEANDIIKTADGGYLLGGITQSGQNGDVSENGYFDENSFWAVKIDANGVKQWDKRFIPQYLLNMNGGATLKSVLNTPDGGYLLGGYSKPAYEPINNNTQTNDYFVVKLNSAGAKQWEKLYNNNDEQDYLNSMQPTSDGGFLLVGNTSTANGNVWLLKINSSGVKQWDKQYGGSDNDIANTIIPVTGENNFLIGGSSSSGISGDKTEAARGMSDLWAIKVTSDGTKIWDKTIGGTGLDYLYRTAFDSNNDIFLGAFTASPTSGERTGNGPGAWFVKIASNCPPQTSAFITLGDSLTLKANPCTGTINWSNGMTGSSLIIKPVINTVYTATCSTICTSPASPPFSVTVSTGICETVKSGSWTDPTTWSCNRVPTSTDDIIINVGHTITDNGSTIRAKTLNYRGGILQISQTTNFILGN